MYPVVIPFLMNERLLSSNKTSTCSYSDTVISSGCTAVNFFIMVARFPNTAYKTFIYTLFFEYILFQTKLKI